MLICLTAAAQDNSLSEPVYQMPPDEIAALIDAPPTPRISIGPDGEWMAILDRPGYPSIEELALPELRLAGLRIDPKVSGPSRISYYTGITFKKIASLDDKELAGLPEKARIGNFSWSPDGQKIAFTNTSPEGIELWVADIDKAIAMRLGQFYLNDIYGSPYYWHPDSRTLICKIIPPDRGDAPEASPVPSGPVIRQNDGEIAPAVTYADLLMNSHDEALLEYFLQCQLTIISLDGEMRNIGRSGMIAGAEPSPDGQYILVETIHRPFSYTVPISRFPRLVEVWNLEGTVVRKVVDQPLAENIPTVSDAVRTGPRDINWRSDEAAMLYWAEALDNGDPRLEAEVRDQIYTLVAPFKGNPIPLFALNFRYNFIIWSSDDLAIIYEKWWKTRNIKAWAFAPGSMRVDPELIFDYSREDRYHHPGTPMTHNNEAGKEVLLLSKDGKSMFLTGEGGSPEGDRPFLDKLNLVTKEKTRLWQSEAPYYETVLDLPDPGDSKILTMRESITEPPNAFVRDLDNAKLEQITFFPNPTPQLMEIQKEQIRYAREDGLSLTATLYLPAGYTPESGPLPMLMWAYPTEFKSADAAGQVTDSPYRFIRVGWWSPILWVTRGYAILDDAGMPIVGEGDEEPNDSFVEQLVADARAAVDEVVRRGVADRNRIAVGGHSYGAFMAANLLAHSDLFRAGLARSGAYNRTLTPFGFQNEDRTLWESPETYYEMSPFMHVDSINEPILLVHGELDNNSGTYPMQSERFYNALKGYGATVRLVMLPYESHSYRARESIMHVLWESDRWLEKYVKNAPPREVDNLSRQSTDN
ncbi:MAG: S9 family peptidase [candidate division Zixibacteria bacterium HGW-Zixibacteria-1]|nr:MAG: S9 family peptidase [candidate division Zixibacteria bacterium HGW-Zixibacteria-1]